MISVAQKRLMFKMRRFARTVDLPSFEANGTSDAMIEFIYMYPKLA